MSRLRVGVGAVTLIPDLDNANVGTICLPPYGGGTRTLKESGDAAWRPRFSISYYFFCFSRLTGGTTFSRDIKRQPRRHFPGREGLPHRCSERKEKK